LCLLVPCLTNGADLRLHFTPPGSIYDDHNDGGYRKRAEWSAMSKEDTGGIKKTPGYPQSGGWCAAFNEGRAGSSQGGIHSDSFVSPGQ